MAWESFTTGTPRISAGATERTLKGRKISRPSTKETPARSSSASLSVCGIPTIRIVISGLT